MQDDRKSVIIRELQRGLPIEERPFRALARTVGATEDTVLDVVRACFDEGTARRFGAVFDARRLGYRSELCALSVPETQLDSVGHTMAACSGVTHAYLRGHPPGVDPFHDMPGVTRIPNLWFTLAVLHAQFEPRMAQLQAQLGAPDLWRLPAVRRFKIDVTFDPSRRDLEERAPGMPLPPQPIDAVPAEADAAVFTERQRELVRAIEGNVPLRADFYAGLAAALGWDRNALLDQLRAWQTSGVLRRMALIVRHRELGFRANAMCVWPVHERDVVAAGRRLAAFRGVTHCYERVARQDWPYNLYAMIHTGSWSATHELFKQLAADIEIDNGRMLGSLREFKKTSMHYFGADGER